MSAFSSSKSFNCARGSCYTHKRPYSSASVQPTDAGQEDTASWRFHIRKRWVYMENSQMVIRMDCYRSRCKGGNDESAWDWEATCSKMERGYCNG